MAEYRLILERIEDGKEPGTVAAWRFPLPFPPDWRDRVVQVLEACERADEWLLSCSWAE